MLVDLNREMESRDLILDFISKVFPRKRGEGFVERDAFTRGNVEFGGSSQEFRNEKRNVDF